MDNYQMSSLEVNRATIQAEEVNRRVNNGKAGEKGAMDKDAFLKLLVTQLKHQDPTRPMEDREFIAQMAQFSSLEQITNMNKEFKTLIRSSQSSEAYRLLGKRIESYDPVKQKVVSGLVSSIIFDKGEVRVKVGGEEVSLDNIHSVSDMEKISLTKE